MQLDPKLNSLLLDLEKTREIFWNLNREAAQLIHQLIIDKNYKNILEIGTSNGYSGIWLALAAKQTGGHLYTIESHAERFAIAKSNFEKANLSEFITQIKGHAPEVIPKTPTHFDLAFFDATKFEHPLYLKAILTRLSPGGTIITDNIISHQEQLKDYVEIIQNLGHFDSTLYNIDQGLLVSTYIPAKT